MPLTEVLAASMEYDGFAVDTAGIRQFGEQLKRKSNCSANRCLTLPATNSIRIPLMI